MYLHTQITRIATVKYFRTKKRERSRVFQQADPEEDDGDGHDADVETRHEVAVTEDVDDVSEDADEEEEVADPVEDVPSEIIHTVVHRKT